MRTTEWIENKALSFKPNSVKDLNGNDIRAFVYEWFANFEHIVDADYFLSHLDESEMEISFPEQKITNHTQFKTWYADVQNHIPWDFHDLSNLEIVGNQEQGFIVKFIVNWHGEVSNQTQIDGKYTDSWNLTEDSPFFHKTLRQTWQIKVQDGVIFITNYVVEDMTPVG